LDYLSAFDPSSDIAGTDYGGANYGGAYYGGAYYGGTYDVGAYDAGAYHGDSCSRHDRWVPLGNALTWSKECQYLRQAAWHVRLREPPRLADVVKACCV